MDHKNSVATNKPIKKYVFAFSFEDLEVPEFVYEGMESEFTFRVREKEFDKIDDALNELKRLYKKRCDELNNQITNSTTVSKG